MSVGFDNAHGSAQKTGLEYVKLEFGENRVRMVGDLRARYSYWAKMKSATIPVECLSFDPEQEKFTNIEKDWYKHYFPEAKCVWSYVIQVIDSTGGLKLLGLKRKLFDQVQTAAKTLGDPTSITDGYVLVIDKKKTGSSVFNVEYTLDVLQTQKTQGPLTDEELETIKDMKSIDELVPRQTADEQKAFIESSLLDTEEEVGVDNEAIGELDPSVHEDVKF